MKFTLTLISFLSAFILLTANSHASDIIIDPNGVDMGQYQADLNECVAISEQVDSKAGSTAVKGAVVGGAVGASRGNSDQAKQDAGVGAALGLAKGASATNQEKLTVQKNCLTNKGYTVLN